MLIYVVPCIGIEILLDLKILNSLMAVTDIDDENGPFYCLEKKINVNTFLTFQNLVSTTKKGERGKVSLEEFSKHFKDNETLKFSGKSGTAIFYRYFFYLSPRWIL